MKTSLKTSTSLPLAEDYEGLRRIVQLITSSRERVLQSVNSGMIDLSWKIGEKISQKITATGWGDGVVEQLATYLGRSQPGMRGFT